MAIVTLREEGRVLREPGAIRDFLEGFGLWYRRFEGELELGADASEAQVLAAYDEPVQKLMAEGGYVTADVVNIHPEIPELDAMLARFEREHTHAEDEVRFIVSGRGLFHVHPEDGPVFSIEVEAGDLIKLPRGIRHWFHVCDARRCRAVRLFQDKSGWEPHYTDSGIEQRFAPLWQGEAARA